MSIRGVSGGLQRSFKAFDGISGKFLGGPKLFHRLSCNLQECFKCRFKKFKGVSVDFKVFGCFQESIRRNPKVIQGISEEFQEILDGFRRVKAASQAFRCG